MLHISKQAVLIIFDYHKNLTPVICNSEHPVFTPGGNLSFRVQFDENALASATNLAAEAGTSG
jgi:hypothetical protein